MRKMSEDRNQKSGLKTDSAPGRLGRSNELFDRFEDDRKLFVVFLLERGEFLRKLASAEQRLAHPDEGTGLRTKIDKEKSANTLTRVLPRRSPVSQTDNAVYPTASPHVVFICTARGLRRTFAAWSAPCSVKA